MAGPWPPNQPCPPQSLDHFTHPNHILHEAFLTMEYLCNACHTLGQGRSYTCTTCDCNYTMHDCCATCPRQLASHHLHPEHDLTLVYCIPPPSSHCNLCGETVNRLFYSCSICKFCVHPVCTLLPQQVLQQRQGHHHGPKQLFKLHRGNGHDNETCSACGQPCTSWWYRCGTCNENLHIDCIVSPPPSNSYDPRAKPTGYGRESRSPFGWVNTSHQFQPQVYNFAPPIQAMGYPYPPPTPCHAPYPFSPPIQPMGYPYPPPTPCHAPYPFSPPIQPMANPYPPPTPCHAPYPFSPPIQPVANPYPPPTPYYTAASGGSDGTGGQGRKNFYQIVAQLALTAVVSGLTGGSI